MLSKVGRQNDECPRPRSLSKTDKVLHLSAEFFLNSQWPLPPVISNFETRSSVR
jgi:hypothetical protein